MATTDGGAAAGAPAAGGGAQLIGAGGPATRHTPVDYSVFRKTMEVVAVRVPSKECSRVQQELKDVVLKLPRTRCVQVDPTDDAFRLVRLDHSLTLDTVPAAVKQQMEKLNGTASLVTDKVESDHTNMTANDILAKLLPAGFQPLSGFETIGHVAHLNLNDEYLPYKYMIGQVVLDKNPKLRTVVNKIGSIHATFRTFDMELLAGEEDLEVSVRESDCTFKFNFRDVYWNSRLQHEHTRVVETTPKSTVVCDMFAGVGPFAVPLGKRKIVCYANDLNPKSYEALKNNIALNHVQKFVHPYNMDGRDFVRQLVADGIHFDSVLMNLPASAELFLDVFIGLFPAGTNPEKLPVVNCYCFSKCLTPELGEADALQRIEDVIGYSFPDKSVVKIRLVRDVAPRKFMYCASFKLPAEVAIAGNSHAKRKSADDSVQSDSKVRRIEAGHDDSKSADE